MSQTPTLSGRRVWVIEDVAAIRLLAESVLRAAGADVQGMGTIAEARRALRKHPAPDAACIDLSLPDGDGRELVPLLAPSLRILMSADRSARPDHPNTELAFDASIVKHEGLRDLANRIGEMLRYRTPSPTSPPHVAIRRLDADAIDSVEQEYRKSLQASRRQLDALLRTPETERDHHRIEVLLHRLRGTSAVQGDDHIARACRELKRALHEPRRFALHRAWDALVNAIDSSTPLTPEYVQ